MNYFCVKIAFTFPNAECEFQKQFHFDYVSSMDQL